MNRMAGDAPTSDNSVFVLATFNRTLALPVLVILTGLISAAIVASIFEMIRNGVSGNYDFLLPIIGLASIALLPYLVRSLRSCWLRKPLLYVENGELIAFDPDFFSQDADKVLSVLATAAPAGVKIVSANGAKTIWLALAMQGGDEVSRRWSTYLAS